MARNSTDDVDTTIAENGIVREDFSVILSQAFATYGLSVVTDRALPDARDGLKPVQRRILAGMREARYLSSRPTVKSAEVVGLILGNYHPHGDASVYEAAARMSQPFTLRYPLIEGQGNMGSEDGDDPAAYRYTEMRLSPLAEAVMADMERATVPLHPTYKQDPKVLEPDYLPGHIPPIVNPSSGIAVGMSTNIPSHNLGEVMRACIALLDRPEMTVAQIMEYIQGPDFSQGGRVVGVDGIKDYFTTGKGRIFVRSDIRLEETPRSRSLVVTQIPPIGRDKVKNSIVKAINARKLEGLMPDMRDESDTEKGTRIVLELRKDADPGQMVALLFKETDLQVALSFQMVFLFGEPMQPGRQPRQVGVVELLNYWNNHQIDVLTRRTQYELRKAQERLHVVDGLMVGAQHAEEVVRIFQQAEDRSAARKIIEERYSLTPIQSDVIASMTLSQVTRLDADRYVRERVELQTRISELENILADRKVLIATLKKEMQQLIRQFGDERRTVIDTAITLTTPITEVASLHEREPLLVALTRNGALKALTVDAFKLRGKGNDAVLNTVRGDEQLRQVIKTTTQDYVLCICSTGRVCQVAAHRLAVVTRSAKGEAIDEILALQPDESVVAILPVDNYDEDRYLVTFSAQGKVKKSPLSEYRAVHVDGVPDMKLVEGDTIVSALISRGRGDYFVSTDIGITLRFSDEQLRAQGRSGQGVAAIALNKGGEVVSASYLDEEPDIVGDETVQPFSNLISLIVFTRNGIANKIPASQFPQKGRATSGIVTIELQGDDQVLQTFLVRGNDTFLLATTGGRNDQPVVLKAADIKGFARAHQGSVISENHILNVLLLP
ncbi:DNA gyrase subunit A [Ktedonobacteria bacterium brp13]|nr:DNA gyrase subunit A [Ktedonobacteria bacterium brp13]